MTREQIENLKVGDVIEETWETRNCEPMPGARWHIKTVTKITLRGVNTKGEAYVGDGLHISFDATEGENHIRIPATS